MQHQERYILALQVHCQQERLEIGSAPSASAWTTLLHAARKTHWIENHRFCLSRPLLGCSQLRAIGLLCTKKLGRVAPLLGGQGLPTLAEQCEWVLLSGTRGPPGHPRRLDQWLVLGPEVMHTGTMLSYKSPCCISKSVLKLSCCSKAFQSVWMQHF